LNLPAERGLSGKWHGHFFLLQAADQNCLQPGESSKNLQVGGGPAPHFTSGVSAASSPLQGLFCSVVPKPKHA